MSIFWRRPGVKACCYYWLPALLLTGFILLVAGDLGAFRNTKKLIPFLMSLFPSLTLAQAKSIHLGFRKTAHFLSYALLFAAWVRTLRWHLIWAPWKAILYALGICLAVALLDEGRQTFFASRTGNPWDVLLDLSGALTAFLALFPILRVPLALKTKELPLGS